MPVCIQIQSCWVSCFIFFRHMGRCKFLRSEEHGVKEDPRVLNLHHFLRQQHARAKMNAQMQCWFLLFFVVFCWFLLVFGAVRNLESRKVPRRKLRLRLKLCSSTTHGCTDPDQLHQRKHKTASSPSILIPSSPPCSLFHLDSVPLSTRSTLMPCIQSNFASLVSLKFGSAGCPGTRCFLATETPLPTLTNVLRKCFSTQHYPAISNNTYSKFFPGTQVSWQWH